MAWHELCAQMFKMYSQFTTNMWTLSNYNVHTKIGQNITISVFCLIQDKYLQSQFVVSWLYTVKPVIKGHHVENKCDLNTQLVILSEVHWSFDP